MTEEVFMKNCFKIIKLTEEAEKRLSNVYKKIKMNELKVLDNRDLISEEKIIKSYWEYYSRNSSFHLKLLKDGF